MVVDSSTKTILIVDDNPSVTMVLSYALIEAGYNVCTADDGEAALTLCEKQHVDGAVIDVHMPKLNGIDVCRVLLGRPTDVGTPLPVWLITGAPSAQVRECAAKAGALAVLAKPFTLTEILERLAQQFQKGSSLACVDHG